MRNFTDLTENEKQAAVEFFKAANFMSSVGGAGKSLFGEASSLGSDIGGGFKSLYKKYSGRAADTSQQMSKDSPFRSASWKLPLLAYGGLGAYAFGAPLAKGLVKLPFGLARGGAKMLTSPIAKILRRGK